MSVLRMVIASEVGSIGAILTLWLWRLYGVQIMALAKAGDVIGFFYNLPGIVFPAALGIASGMLIAVWMEDAGKPSEVRT